MAGSTSARSLRDIANPASPPAMTDAVPFYGSSKAMYVVIRLLARTKSLTGQCRAGGDFAPIERLAAYTGFEMRRKTPQSNPASPHPHSRLYDAPSAAPRRFLSIIRSIARDTATKPKTEVTALDAP